MINQERYYRILGLVVLMSFFLFQLSNLIILFGTSLEYLVYGTFLESFVNIINIFFIALFGILKYVSLLFTVGGIIGLITIFLNDYLFKPTK